MANIAIILSGGTGSRLGSDVPKQYLSVGGKPIINYCLQTFLDCERIDSLVIVLAEEWRPFMNEQLKHLKTQKKICYADSGETRQYSIYNGLKKVKEMAFDKDDIVVIHDAARPLCSEKLINRCLDACTYADGAMPAINVKDTVYLSEDGIHIKALFNRSQLRAGQAPEAFSFGKYIKAHEEMKHEDLIKINGSTEIAFKAGLKCVIVEGDPMNIKITTPEDLINFENIINNI
jgi:2-C-methyl-D-erythritol 4-phosphate cytidylyltransferase